MGESLDLDGPLVSTGIAGLDDIVRGGLPSSRLYLIEGNPGSGKTTLSLQFLIEGVRLGEPTLYVTLSETKQELLSVARSHGWSLDGIDIHEMEASEESLAPDSQLTMFHPSELELSETTKKVLVKVEKHKPKRVVFDSLSEMRLLAHNPLRYRRQILGLKQFFAGRQSTVLLLDDKTGGADDLQLQSIAHGVIHLEQTITDYGAERRRLTVRKMRGVGFRGGMHDYVIRRGGLDVFPRLVAAEHQDDLEDEDVPSGNDALDKLLGGGLPAGSSTLLIGPAGIGKSSVGLQFALAAAERGERAALFIFDETVKTLRARARKLDMPLDRHLASGLISVQQVDPAELSPGEFVTILRRAVDGKDSNGRAAKIVMIDSLNGYLHSMPEEKFLNAQLHELFTYLNHRGVSTLVTVTQSGMIGHMQTPVDTTYLADNVILFRYFEASGHVRRAISVMKKRSGSHELTIREMTMGIGGLAIGDPLDQFQGVLTGVPSFVGADKKLMDAKQPPAGGDVHGR
ncbi:MAG TPA: ATPase domain-containing protein [Tepidisphaeraceae bacterium]|nr:ATPase domain-containing protein [Tepidisphaeraceae bacterium]